MQFSSDIGNKRISFIAQDDDELRLFYEIMEVFRSGNGSIEIAVRDHRDNAMCLDCQAAKKYRDCITASANFSRQQEHETLSIIHPCRSGLIKKV